MPTSTRRRPLGPADRPVQYRLLRDHGKAQAWIPSPEQQAVVDHTAGRLRVLAGPGTGKTATIVEAVAERVRRGDDPQSILVLTFSRRAAGELTSRLAQRLDVTVGEPLVRTLHAYAYAVVRAAAQAADDPPPRLLEAGQADAMVREMLSGHADMGRGSWPADLQPALRSVAFASELRELSLRAAERGMTPRDIAALGRQYGRPEWQAAAAFITEYHHIGDLRQGTARLGAALDQAELTTAALDRLSDPQVLTAEQARIRRVFVDEYQDVDPAQAAMIKLLASGAEELIVVGDPDQSIYAFRGAEAKALDEIEVDSTVSLHQCYRMPAELVSATRRVAERLPGPTDHRQLEATQPAQSGRFEVRITNSAAQEAAWVVDQFRRAHIERGVPWSQMVILLRAPLVAGDAFRRACVAAGVPVSAGPTGPLNADGLVAALLLLLRVGQRPGSLTGAEALTLLTSPLTRMDPLAVRRLRRAVRGESRQLASSQRGASSEILARILRGEQDLPGDLPADLARPVRTLAALVDLAREGADEPAAETVLWRIWQRSGLASQLLTEAEQRDSAADRANSWLDAAVALFDRAAELAIQLPSAGVSGLLEMVADDQIPAPAPTRHADAVSILSAHAAKGLQWEVVAVVHVQHDSWPDLRPRTSLLHLSELMDVASGIDPNLPAVSQMADERRLFYVAVTRAREQLIVTAVDDDENTPSRFLTELVGSADIPTGWPVGAENRPRRALNISALVADLRRAVSQGSVSQGSVSQGSGGQGSGGQGSGGQGSEVQASGGQPTAEEFAAHSRRAAAALAQLSRAGVAAAHPRAWYGLAPLSTQAPLVPPDQAVRLSPSQVESLMQCPLRTVLERNGGRRASSPAIALGIAVHALAEGLAANATNEQLRAALDEFVEQQNQLAGWERDRLRRLMTKMQEALLNWVEEYGQSRTFVGSELLLELTLPPGADDPADPRDVQLRGRVDWLATDGDGNYRITDFKTGSTAVTYADAAEHPQLAVYQLAAALGAFDDDPEHPGLGGAELVYLRKGVPELRPQQPLDSEQQREWSQRLRELGQSSAGSALTARIGPYCDYCPVRSSCPIQPEGRQVTRP